MNKALTEKGKALIKTKEFNGEKYALMDSNVEKEIWLKVIPEKSIECLRCGYTGAGIDRHHIHGRKNSDETIYLCSNCHRELHAGEWSL